MKKTYEDIPFITNDLLDDDFYKHNTATRAYELGALLVTAFEGGINYWADIKNRRYDESKYDVYYAIVNGRGYIEISDIEDIDYFDTLSLGGLIAALEIMKTTHKKEFLDILTGSYDAGTADILIQLAVWGQVIYG